jgi:hypothetical protein
MAFSSVKDIVNAELEGRVRRYWWRKTPSAATTAGLWFDLSMSPGNPPPKYWFDASPLTSKAAYQSTDGGIFHGASVTGYEKILAGHMAMTVTATALPLTIWICDYVLYYPSIDEGTTDAQALTNTVTLPRYTTGKGLQILPVTVGTRTTAADFFVTYTNDSGVAGRTSSTVTLNTGPVGTVAASSTATQTSGNPFIGLQSGDTGVRSIDSVTMTTSSDGLFSLLLVKPLATNIIRGIDAPTEKNYAVDQMEFPEIQSDAYISMLCLPQGSLSGTALIGDMKVLWN